MMYDMQVASYDANLCFFMDKITIYVIIQHTKSYNMFFALNLKICRMLRSMIRSYDPQSTILSTSHDPT